MPSEAVILSVAESGWTLNDNYDLAKPRVRLPVVVDPSDRTRVAVG